jgi:hypothetical protein
MNKPKLIAYLEAIDGALREPAKLYIYGSAALILLDEPERTSLDMDVAGPYSQANEADVRQAAEQAGLPVNPSDEYDGDHIEWVGPLRLCLQPPVDGTGMLLWQGSKLRIESGSAADLVASKLIRYDEIDRSDIQYLLAQGHTGFSTIAEATMRLPAQFAQDPLVKENLENLRTDMGLWGFATND